MSSDKIDELKNGVEFRDDFCQVGESFCERPAPPEWQKSSFIDSTMVEFEREMRNSMMGKVMENFEKQMMEQTKLIDEIKHQQDESFRQMNKERNSKHIPLELKNEGVRSAHVWQRVHDFLTDPSFDDASDSGGYNRKATMKCLNPHTYQVLLSHGIGAWFSTLDSDHLEKLMNKIYADTSQWISKIWRFRCTTPLYHSKQYDGFLNVCQVALADRYPKYSVDGYNSLYSRPPVIYINSAVDPGFVSYLRIHLALPMDSISLVPNNFELGGDESMDPMTLETLILADISAGKMPLIIYAFAGSPNTGSMDHLNDIHNLCREHKIWLHMEGLRLAQLALLQVPAKVNTISSKVKSVTLDIGSWLGIPAVPYTTLIMTEINETYLHTLGFGVYNSIHDKAVMNIFPIWMSLQLMGHDGITERIESTSRISNELYKSLKEIQSIKLTCRMRSGASKPAKTDSSNKGVPESNSIKNLMDTALTFLLEGHIIPSVILFRYNPSMNHAPCEADPTKPVVCVNHEEDNLMIKKPRFVDSEDSQNRMYLNSLNQWLADNLSGTFPQINLKTINLPSEGLCMRICFQENINCQDIKSDDISKFVASMKEHITIMDSTVTRRNLFQEIVESKEDLVFIDLPAWAGLGAVLYIPESCRSIIQHCFTENSINNENIPLLHMIASSLYLNEINSINRTLITELRNDDEAFSLGRYQVPISVESEDNAPEMATLFCVRFGLIMQTTNISQLIDLVIKKAHHVEESSKYLEKLSQLVKDGIVKATEDLAREQEEKVKQEGIFRQVPYIESLINWWSPPSKTQIIGRSLNLSSGEINATEDIYKYKMQLQSGPNSVFSIGIGDQTEDPVPNL